MNWLDWGKAPVVKLGGVIVGGWRCAVAVAKYGPNRDFVVLESPKMQQRIGESGPGLPSERICKKKPDPNAPKFGLR